MKDKYQNLENFMIETDGAFRGLIEKYKDNEVPEILIMLLMAMLMVIRMPPNQVNEFVDIAAKFVDKNEHAMSETLMESIGNMDEETLAEFMPLIMDVLTGGTHE